MTISNLTNTYSVDGDGAEVDFTPPYKFFSTGTNYPDIQVYLRTIATGFEVLQTYTTHYTVLAGGGGDPTPATGTIRMVTAPATTEEIHIVRLTGQLQNLSFPVGGEFPAARTESALDRAAMRSIDREGEIDRALRLPASDPASALLPNSSDRASKLLAFDSTGELVASSESVPAATSSFMSPIL